MPLLLTLTLTAGTVRAQHAESWRDVSYAADTLMGHRMDIYLPESGEVPYPVVVVIAAAPGSETTRRSAPTRL